jgi:vacuolar iron transporter family protein
MKASLRIGLSFGLTSAVITTLGLMVGLNSGTHSKLAVLGGILTIAVADAFSDALGIHVSEESDNKTEKNVWESTGATFISKLIIALTFVLPVIFLELGTAVLVSIIWGLMILGILSYEIAKHRKENSLKVVVEHLLIAIIVIVITHLIGKAINFYF